MEIFTRDTGVKRGFPVVFGHGWARNHHDFEPIAELIAREARTILLDFPGFGNSPRPETAWGTEEYANAIKEHLADTLGLSRYIWVGHSFGARVGLRLAAMTNSPVDHLFVVAGAGIKRPQGWVDRMRGKIRSRSFKRKKARAKTEAEIIALEKAYGSADYVMSRDMRLRDVFLKTVQEDQSAMLANIRCPTTLIYGEKDTETPPALGREIQRLISGSIYVECPEFDHHSILSRGRHQVAVMLLEELSRYDK